MSWLRSLVFTALLFVSVPPYALLVLIARAFGRIPAYRMAKTWIAHMVGLAGLLCGLRFEVTGLENIPREPSVALIKHSSAYETLVQFLLFPRQSWVLKRELMWAPFFGWALACLAPIAINRQAGSSAVEQVIAQGRARLNEGLWVNVFPEGTRMPMGETRRYGVSGTLLAQRAGCLIVPVAHDAGDFWPRRGLRKRPGTVRFVIGRPVDPGQRDVRDVNRDIQTWIEATVAEIRAGRTQGA